VKTASRQPSTYRRWSLNPATARIISRCPWLKKSTFLKRKIQGARRSRVNKALKHRIAKIVFKR